MEGTVMNLTIMVFGVLILAFAVVDLFVRQPFLLQAYSAEIARGDQHFGGDWYWQKFLRGSLCSSMHRSWLRIAFDTCCIILGILLLLQFKFGFGT